jgi:hypothetical protein
VRQLRTPTALFIAALAAALAVSPARADELVLKNGKKIVGTIVGYEHDMFRVETDFGVALVRKDKVVSINISASEDAAAKGGKNTAPTAQPTAEGAERAAQPRPRAAQAEPPPAAGDSSRPAPPPQKPSVPPPQPPKPAVSRLLDEPLPAQLQEHVEGNTYVNDTFQFAMFKPPGWKVYEGVARETGSGIAAIGAEDEQTLLIVDRQVWSGAPDLKSDEAEGRLRRTYQDYQKLSEESDQCDGQPAIRRTFKGVLDGVEWHGVAVHVARGNTVFGIIGLTSAEMYQFQQAVLNKIINSFYFLAPSPGTPARPPAGAP